VHWILQENLFKESEWENLVSTLERFGVPYSVHKVVPFVGELQPDVDVPGGRAICFGSYSMRHVAKAKGWNPGVYDLEPFDFTAQVYHWTRHMLNADAELLPFEEVKFDGLMFVRPVKDSKVFAGTVFDGEEFEEWRHLVCELNMDYGTSLASDTLVQVCRPKEIYQEARFWVVDGKIVTQSLYKRGRTVIYSDIVDSHLRDFAQSMVDIWRPLDAFVIDVCDTPHGPRVVEINTINSAGFYAANVTELVLALEEYENERHAHTV
jgi:hypothetical protein